MIENLGRQMLAGKMITAQQLDKARERQRLHHGRLCDNLIAMGAICQEDLANFTKLVPPPPQSVEGTGLDLAFIADLVLKHVHYLDDFTALDVVPRIKLPMAVVSRALDELRRERFLEVKGATEFTKSSYRFGITEQGKRQAAELLEICRYVGPAPVILEDYQAMVEEQTVQNIIVDTESIRRAFSHIVVDDHVLHSLGPAITSGKAIFLYGPPGNGKTTVAEAVGSVLPGTIFLPYAILIGGEIITVYDPVSHVAVTADGDCAPLDQRWLEVRRPVVMVGGEFTLKMLELNYNHIAKIYEAPVQMKANNGLFIVDDLGRQQLDPQLMLNRWIVPLERGTDFLALHTGMKFEIPFDQLVIFATNQDPKKLVDEAFLRRIRYKIKINHPTVEEYEQIFRRVCDLNAVPFRKKIFAHLIANYYQRHGVKLNSCHPRDIIDHIVAAANFHRYKPELTEESIAYAWNNYFVEI